MDNKSDGNTESSSSRDFKDFEESYMKTNNRNLLDIRHHGDIVPASRLLGYVDVILATCATFLVIPLKNLKDASDSESLIDFFEDSTVIFVFFVAGSLLICTIWESINIRYIIVKHLDDVLIVLTILSMLFITILPLTFLLVGHYPKEDIAVYLLCTALIIVEIIEIIMNIYTFSSPWLFHPALHVYQKEDFDFLRNTMCIKNMINILFLLLGVLFTMLDYRIPWIFIAMILLLPHTRKAVFFTYTHIYGAPDKSDCVIFIRFVKGNISKERIESFADAAVAVIACILILDITVEELYSKPNNEHLGLVDTLKHMSLKIYIFLGTYIMVSLLWYINHTVLNLFQSINTIIIYLQKFYLLLVCWVPFTANILHHYLMKNNKDTTITVRFTSVVMFFASLCNLMMLFWAMFFDEKLLHKWASYTCFDNLRQHFYILLKLLNIPLWSGILFFGTFGHVGYLRDMLIVCFALVVICFVLLKVLFSKRSDNLIIHGGSDSSSETSPALYLEDAIVNTPIAITEKVAKSNIGDTERDMTTSEDSLKINIVESEYVNTDKVKQVDHEENEKESREDSVKDEGYGSVMKGVVNYFNGVESEIFHESVAV